MRTQDARTIHINEYLSRIGARFARTQKGTHGLEYVYHSPARDDQKPSLCVNLDRNIWSDVPAGQGGRLIELVCYLNDLPANDVSGALAILDAVFPEYRGSGHSLRARKPIPSPFQSVIPEEKAGASPATGLKKKRAQNELLAVREIHWYPLKHYLEERKIPLALAKLYLKEIEYRSPKGQIYKALGWKAGETYVLRNKSFKGFLNTGATVTVFDEGTQEILVFEGFFDFLTYLVIQKRKKPPLTAVILNSVAMYPHFKRFVDERPNIERIYCYFDHDAAGRTILSSLKADFSSKILLSDCSLTYEGFKDFNAWFCAQ